MFCFCRLQTTVGFILRNHSHATLQNLQPILRFTRFFFEKLSFDNCQLTLSLHPFPAGSVLRVLDFNAFFFEQVADAVAFCPVFGLASFRALAD